MFVCELCYLQETNAENQIQIFLCREDVFAVDIVDALFYHLVMTYFFKCHNNDAFTVHRYDGFTVYRKKTFSFTKKEGILLHRDNVLLVI